MRERFAADTIRLAHKLVQQWHLAVAFVLLGCCGGLIATLLPVKPFVSILIVTQPTEQNQIGNRAPAHLRPLIDRIGDLYLDPVFMHRRFVATLRSSQFISQFYAEHCDTLSSNYSEPRALLDQLLLLPSGRQPSELRHTAVLKDISPEQGREILPTLMTSAWQRVRIDMLGSLNSADLHDLALGYSDSDIEAALQFIRLEVEEHDFTSSSWRYVDTGQRPWQWIAAGAMAGLLVAIAFVGAAGAFLDAHGRRTSSEGPRAVTSYVALLAIMGLGGACLAYVAQQLFEEPSTMLTMTSRPLAEFACRYGKDAIIRNPDLENEDEVEDYLRYRYLNPVTLHRRMAIELKLPRNAHEFYAEHSTALVQWYSDADTFFRSISVRQMGSNERYPLQHHLRFLGMASNEARPWVERYIEAAQQRVRKWTVQAINTAEPPFGGRSAADSSVAQEVLARAKARLLPTLGTRYLAYPTWSIDATSPFGAWTVAGMLCGLLGGAALIARRRRRYRDEAEQ